ncbi:MAG: hypothetical protein V1755_00780 [Chloroflexota bacterium]
MKKKRRGGKASEHSAEPTFGRVGLKPASPIPAARAAGTRRHRPSLRDGAQGPASIANPQARRPGGQPGNSNALKHGFHSSLFKEKERQLLAQVPVTDLAAEIELIRVTTTRFLEALTASKGDLDFERNLTALCAVNLSAQSIATLLRVQAFNAAINRDAADALEHLDALEPDDPPSSPCLS